jgi:hypothetical protein
MKVPVQFFLGGQNDLITHWRRLIKTVLNRTFMKDRLLSLQKKSLAP